MVKMNICFIQFKIHSKNSALNSTPSAGCDDSGLFMWRWPGDGAGILPDFYINTLPAMMNASISSVFNRQLQKKHDHRFVSVSVTVYAGKAAGVLSYEPFNLCCVLLPGDRWKNMEPRTGCTVQIQGNSPFPYPY
jgi:hypothetical protein